MTKDEAQEKDLEMIFSSVYYPGYPAAQAIRGYSYWPALGFAQTLEIESWGGYIMLNMVIR